MNFIDHTGHIFSLESYEMEPIGYEYEENKYIFWFDSEYGYKMSVNNYYFKPIRVLIPIIDETSDVEVNIKSSDNSLFKLMGSKQIQTMLSRNADYKQNVSIEEKDFVYELNTEDIVVVKTIKEELGKAYKYWYKIYYEGETKMPYNGPEPIDGIGYVSFGPLLREVEVFDDYKLIPIEDENQIIDGHITIDGKTYEVETVYQHYALVPFYVVFRSSNEGVWETNLLIHTISDNGEDYCAITVGAECVDEIEELIINGKNTGVNLPKQILKAVYQSSYHSEYPDERLYTNKLKEYLMNFMKIKGEQGNFRSAINSLKWFGWGDKVSINKLWQTDNILQNQYIRDSFDISNDTIYSYQCFRNSTLISLSVPTNKELEETEFDFPTDPEDKKFWGEAKPKMENLFEKNIVMHYDEQDIDFYRGYFDYTFDELGLKLCALKYYYDKYFLPIHLNIASTSLEWQQFTNDIKLITKATPIITEQPVLTNTGVGNYTNITSDFDIVFPGTNIQYLMCQTHFIDDNYCEFEGSYKLGTIYNENIYYINDTVVNIPIQFVQKNKEQYYNCHLLLLKDNEVIHECSFQFVQKMNDRDSIFKNFVIHPKTLNTVITGNQKQKYDLNYWVDSDYIIYLSVNNIWYSYAFNMKFPEVNMHLGRLEYKYYLDTYDRYEDLYGKVTLFKQLDGFGEDYIKFNSFMFQPDLVDINNTDFITDLINYAKANNLTYVNGETINSGKYYFYIEYKNKRYIFSSQLTSVLVSETGTQVYTVVDTEEVKIRRRSNGTYTLRIKHPEGSNEPLEVTGLTLKTTMYHNLKDYIKRYYTVSNNYVDNKYLNRCHLIDIYDENGNMLEYNTNDEVAMESFDIDNKKFSFGNNSSKETIDLYKTFFDENGDSILDKVYNPNEYTYITLNRIGGMYYDLYLMHDKSNWYFVMISRSTIKNFAEANLKFDFDKTINKIIISGTEEHKEYELTYDSEISNEYFLMIDDTINNKEYYLKYNRSDNKILLNRLQFNDSKGINHFDSGDIIACTLVNNDRLPFKLGLGSKWTFTPMSIGMVDESYVESPTEMAIVSIGNENSKYSKGYYTVTCNYSFDDFVQHGFEKKGKFRID